MALIVKVCGLKNSQNLKQIVALGVDYVGMIFYAKSPRFVEENPENFKEVTIPKVGVFVNASVQDIADIKSKYGISVAQLHGKESPAFCSEIKSLGLQVWKAFGVDDHFDFSQLHQFPAVDLFLFDTKTPSHGGSGIKFSWDLLKNVPPQFSYLLSGGINLEDAEEIKNLQLPGLKGVDINSKFELSPGIKDIDKVKKMLVALKK